MTLSSIIEKIKDPVKKVSILPNKPKAVSLQDEAPFYVEPSFKELNWKVNAPVILFSAPGAVGKSALAKYVSNKKKSIYWDLSQVKLGQHSLSGMLIESLGAEEYSKYVSDLKCGNQSLVIDALDEADLISGRTSLEILLGDIKGLIGKADTPCVVLLSRAETAIFVQDYLNEISLDFSSYEIGFFTKNNAYDFIKRLVENGGMEYTSLMKQCADMEFLAITNSLEEGESSESFLGYAPVLQAIAKSLIDTANTIKLKNALESQTSGIEIIGEILSKGILDREQNKIVSGMKEQLQYKYPDFDKWDKLYTVDEQIVNITAYIVFGEVMDFSQVQKWLLPEMYAEYDKSVKIMTCQHPFLGKSENGIDFVGPAFRDYAVAKLLALKDGEGTQYVEEYQQLTKKPYIPSQMLFDFYCASENSCNSAKSFSYLYESFLAKETSEITPIVNITDDEDRSARAVFSIKSKQGIQDKVIELKFKEPKLFFKQLINTSIDCAYDVTIGMESMNSRMLNSSIVCNKVCWNGREILLDKPNIIIADTSEIIGGVNPDFVIRDTSLKVSFDNVQNYYQLKKYSFVYCSSDIDSTNVHLSIKKLFGCMRGHKKDTPARDKEFIDFVIMGKSELRKKLLRWLIEVGIIYIDSNESHLYKMDLGKVSEYKLFWSQIVLDDVESEKYAYDEFVRYCSNSKD